MCLIMKVEFKLDDSLSATIEVLVRVKERRLSFCKSSE